MTISFFIPVTPIPYSRPDSRDSRRFNSPRYAEYRRAVSEYAMLVAKENGIGEPVNSDIAASFIFRKNIVASSQQYGDIDNLIKAVLDSFNGIFFVDDRNVVSITATKLCSDNEGISCELTFIGKKKPPQRRKKAATAAKK